MVQLGDHLNVQGSKAVGCVSHKLYYTMEIKRTKTGNLSMTVKMHNFNYLYRYCFHPLVPSPITIHIYLTHYVITGLASKVCILFTYWNSAKEILS